MDLLPNINELITFAIGLSTLGGVLWGAWLVYRKRIREAAAKRRIWQEAMNQLPEALKKIQSIDILAKQIADIRHAVTPNQGSSIPDSIARIEKGIAEGREQRLALAKDIASIGHTIRANQNANPNVAGFECRPDGRVVSVTKTYTRWAGVEVNDLLGWNWINTIAATDRQRIRAEFMSAISDVRNCTVRYLMVNLGTGVAEEVEMTLTSIPENISPCERFVGSIYRVDHMDIP